MLPRTRPLWQRLLSQGFTVKGRKNKWQCCCPGGGAYAACEIAALRAIPGGETAATGGRALQPGIYTGTSAGALNAALLVACSGSAGSAGATPAVEALEKIRVNDLAGDSTTTANGVLHIRLNPFAMLTHPASRFAADALSLSETLVRHGAEFLRSAGPLTSGAMEVY